MMKIGIREILYGLLLLAIPVGAWWFVFRPANEHHEVMRAEIRTNQEKLNRLNRLVGTVGDLEKEIASLEKAIGFLRSKLPTEKEIDKVLRETWRLAEASELSTKSIRTLPKNRQDSLFANDAHEEQPIAIKLEGDFKGFYDFLQALESQPRIMRLTRLTLKKSQDTEEEGVIVADFDVSVFFERGRS